MFDFCIQLGQPLLIGAQVLTGLFPRAVHLLLLALVLLARVARVRDGLLDVVHLGAGGIELALHAVELVVRLGLRDAQAFDLGLDRAQRGDNAFQLGFLAADGSCRARAHPRPGGASAG